MKILIVDDSFSIRRILKNILLELGYKDVEEAEDGVVAMQKMNGIDILLTDWNMPNMSGLELVQKVRAMPMFNNVPIIMITTEGGKNEIINAIKSGVNNYIIKPFTKETVKEKVDQVLAKFNKK